MVIFIKLAIVFFIVHYRPVGVACMTCVTDARCLAYFAVPVY